jgi:hypothetical protein
MKTQDFNAQFERMKKFKEEHMLATDNDEFFKALYSRLRKYVKKLNKMNETQDKIQKGKEATSDQKAMLNKKKELETALEEMSYLNTQYMDNFEGHCEQIWSVKPEKDADATEEHHVEVVEEVPIEVEVKEPEPQIDVGYIRKEEYTRGFTDGRNTGYEEGERIGYESGKSDGYSQAKHDFEESYGQQSNSASSDLERSLNYASIISVMINWFDTFIPLNPQFKRNDYFTEEEIFAIKSLYMMNSANVSAINFRRTIEANSERVKKLINRDDECVLNVHSVSYRQLAESIDRVLENEQFVNTDYQVLAADMMMGMGGYSSMPGMMPGQMFGQFPGSMGAPQQVYNQGVDTQNTANSFVQKSSVAPSHHHEPVRESEPVAQVNEIVHVEYVEPHKPEPARKTYSKEYLAKLNQDQVWNDDDDEDEDDQADSEHDDPESDGGDAGKVNEPVEESTPVDPQTESQEVKEEKFYEDRPYNKRGGQGYNRGTQQRGAYRGYTQNYRGNSSRGYNQVHQGRYRERGSRGDRGNRGDRGGRGDRARGGNRARGSRRGGNDQYYEQHHQGHYQDYAQEESKAEPKEKVDEDDFFIVKEKAFVKKPMKGRKPRPATKPTPATET